MCVSIPALLFAAPPPASPTDTARAVIAGIVTNAEDGSSISGVQVHLEGLGIGTFTNGAGEFMIFGVPPGEQRILFEGHCHYGVGVDVTVTGVEADVRRVDVGLPFNHEEAAFLGCRN